LDRQSIINPISQKSSKWQWRWLLYKLVDICGYVLSWCCSSCVVARSKEAYTCGKHAISGSHISYKWHPYLFIWIKYIIIRSTAKMVHNEYESAQSQTQWRFSAHTYKMSFLNILLFRVQQQQNRQTQSECRMCKNDMRHFGSIFFISAIHINTSSYYIILL
jgi:hypothetical protein